MGTKYHLISTYSRGRHRRGAFVFAMMRRSPSACYPLSQRLWRCQLPQRGSQGGCAAFDHVFQFCELKNPTIIHYSLLSLHYSFCHQTGGRFSVCGQTENRPPVCFDAAAPSFSLVAGAHAHMRPLQSARRRSPSACKLPRSASLTAPPKGAPGAPGFLWISPFSTGKE